MYYNMCLILLSVICLGCTQDTQKTVFVTAHRGASGIAPENTISAMQKAIELGADYSELDVQETSDGVLVLLHDSSLKRTTGIDKNIWEIEYDSLKTLDAGAWFGPEFKGEGIPTLAEVMDHVRGKMKLNIELKVTSHEVNLAERVVELVEQKDFIHECIITSFDFPAIDKVRALNKDITIGYLFSKIPEDIDVFSADVDLFSVKYTIVDAEFVKKAHANNKTVHVYTVNDPGEMKHLVELGVDNIITNYPDRLRAVLHSLKDGS